MVGSFSYSISGIPTSSEVEGTSRLRPSFSNINVEEVKDG